MAALRRGLRDRRLPRALVSVGPGADLRAAQHGSREAIARFYDANVDGLYTFVLYRVGCDAALAEDVVQETFRFCAAPLGAKAEASREAA